MLFWLIVVFIVFIVISNSKKKKQAQGAQAAKPAANGAGATKRPAPPRAPQPRRTAAVKPEPPKPQVEPRVEMSTETYIHIGEGEDPLEHAAHIHAAHEEEEAKRARGIAEKERTALRSSRLREAVVMSEILAKPVSLRKKGERYPY